MQEHLDRLNDHIDAAYRAIDHGEPHVARCELSRAQHSLACVIAIAATLMIPMQRTNSLLEDIDSSVSNVLSRANTPPSPADDRKRSWKNLVAMVVKRG
jgi:hypothetical protein